MKVRKLISILEKCNPEAEVKMHKSTGRNLLFAVSCAHRCRLVSFWQFLSPLSAQCVLKMETPF